MDHPMNKVNAISYSNRKTFSTRHGFTLVELMTVVAIIAILALFAAPEVINWRPKMRLKGAADTLSENMQRAKMHAIKNNVDVVFTFTKGVGTPCKGGNYRITERIVPANVVEDVTMTDNVCLQDSDFVVGDGFTSRGLPINAAARTAKIRNADLADPGDPTYEVALSIAGGISLKKVNLP